MRKKQHKENKIKDNQTESLYDELESIDKEFESLSGKLESKDDEIESLSEELESKDDEIELLRKQIRKLKMKSKQWDIICGFIAIIVVKILKHMI